MSPRKKLVPPAPVPNNLDLLSETMIASFSFLPRVDLDSAMLQGKSFTYIYADFVTAGITTIHPQKRVGLYIGIRNTRLSVFRIKG